MHKSCVPESERPCKRCVKARAECIARKRKKNEKRREGTRKETYRKERLEMKTGVKCENCLTLLAKDCSFCTRCGHRIAEGETMIKQGLIEENEALKEEIIELREDIQKLSGIANWMEYPHWMLLKHSSQLNVPYSIPEDFEILKISSSLSNILSGCVSEGGTVREMLCQLGTSVISFSSSMILENEENVIIKSQVPFFTSSAVFGMERHVHLFLKGRRSGVALMEVKRMWSLKDIHEAEKLMLTLPEKIFSRIASLHESSDDLQTLNFQEQLESETLPENLLFSQNECIFSQSQDLQKMF